MENLNLETATPEQLEAIAEHSVPRLTKYHARFDWDVVNLKQMAFLLLDHEEAGFGGAAGGGKSDGLLMAALQYVDLPRYSALLMRRVFPELSQQGGLIERAHEILNGTDAVWSEKYSTWKFPSGSALQFGHMQYEKTKYQYQGGQFSFVGVDQAEEFEESMYRFMFSRLRGPKGAPWPYRMRSTANPGNPIGHDWYKRTFITEGPKVGRPFVKSLVTDNPHIDQEDYIRKLNRLDPVTRKRLLEGDWDIREEGGMFRREWFKPIDPDEVPEGLRLVRYWDKAATEKKQGNDPDWTAGILLGKSNDGKYYILDVRRFRKDPAGVQAQIRQVADEDGAGVKIVIEQEPGSSGKEVNDYYRRMVLADRTFMGDKVTGSKEERARPLAGQASNGHVYYVRARWNSALLDELDTFPLGKKDQVDALSGAYRALQVVRARVRFV